MSLITDALEKLDDRAKSGKSDPAPDGGIQLAASVPVTPPKRNLKVVYFVSAALLALVAAFCLWRLVLTMEQPAKAITKSRVGANSFAGAAQQQAGNPAGDSVRINSSLQQANPAMPENITLNAAPRSGAAQTPQPESSATSDSLSPAGGFAGANSSTRTDQKQFSVPTRSGGAVGANSFARTNQEQSDLAQAAGGANSFALDGQKQDPRPSSLAIRLSSTLEAKPTEETKNHSAGTHSHDSGTPSQDRSIPSSKLSAGSESANFEKFYRQALDCQNGNDYFSALKWYKECLRIGPDAANVHANMGVIFARMQDSDTAIEHLKKALSIDPENEMAHNNLGVVFLQKGDYEGAISEFETSLIRNPGNIEGYVNLGIACKRLGRQQAALDALEAAMRIDSAHPDANFNYALLLDQHGKYTKARVHYERFLQHAALTDSQTIAQVQDRIRYLEKKPDLQK
jgi:tetratricopeptide (TPR) repeat protein